MSRCMKFRLVSFSMILFFGGANVNSSKLLAQSQPTGGALPAAGMQKIVTEKASFVVYVPAGWKAIESAEEGALLITASDPFNKSEAVMAIGTQPYLGDVFGAGKAVLDKAGRRYPDLQIANSKATRDKKKVVFDGTYTHPQKGQREFRSWLTVDGGLVTCSRIEAPRARLEAEKPLLLTVLANIRVMKGAFASERDAPNVMPLAIYRLRDGSASFQMPQGWKYQNFGKGNFIASDPADTSSFSVGSAEVLSPQLGVRVPGVAVAPFMPPNQAWRLLTEQAGLLSRLQYEKVIPRQDIVQEMARVYTAGPVIVEELIYTCDVKGRRTKGYTFGFSFGSRLNTSTTKT